MFFALGLLALLVPSSALTCYDNDSGSVEEITNSDWKYCVMIPQSEKSGGKLFGISETEDSIRTYEHTFKQTDDVYKVLSICLYEKYDLGKLSASFGEPEFLFRCICNYDKCNSHKSFSGYLSGVQKDNQ